MNQYYSLARPTNDKISTHEIKKGLEKIKKAQIQVLRELKKQPIDSGTTKTTISAQSVSKRQDHLQFKDQLIRQRNRPHHNVYRERMPTQTTNQQLKFKIQNLSQQLQEQSERMRQTLLNQKQIQKQKEFYQLELRKLQTKQLSQLTSYQSNNYYEYLIKEIQSIHKIHADLPVERNKSQQQQFDHHINNIIVYLQNLQISDEYSYISGSFREDIKRIQNEVDKQAKQKQQETFHIKNQNVNLKEEILKLQEKIQRIKGQNKQSNCQISDLEVTINKLREQLQFLKVQNAKLKEQLSIQPSKQEIMGIISNHELLKEALMKMKEEKEKFKIVTEKYDQLRARFEDISIINSDLRVQNDNLKHKHQIEMESVRNQYENLRQQTEQIRNNNIGEKKQWKNMIETIRKLQQQRKEHIERDKYFENKILQLQTKIKRDYEGFSEIQRAMSEEIQKLREENKRRIQETTELQLFRKKKEDETPYKYLWNKREYQPKSMNNI